jgi:succinoglycan biosynthesis transport protein ExoP
VEHIYPLRLLRRWWWVLLLGIAACAGASYTVTWLTTPSYRASATLLVNQAQTPGTLVYEDILASEHLINTYREMITTQPVLEQVIDDLDLAMSQSQLAGMIDAQVLPYTQLIRLSAEHMDPQQAQAVVNATASAFISQSMERQLGWPGTVNIVDAATTPTSPVPQPLMLNAVLGALVGLALAASLILVLDCLDDTIKSAEDVETATGLVTLGSVARFRQPKKPSEALMVRTHPRAQAEAFEILRTNVQFSTLDRPGQTLLVTSANPGDGKTTTVANLALAFAKAGKRVIAVDSDLRRPYLHKLFGLNNSSGLTNVLLSNETDLDGHLQETRFDNLAVLTSGPLPPNPSELLSSERLDAAVAALKERADLLIFDSPPTLAVSETGILAAKTDGTILVVDTGKTRSGALQQAQEILRRSGTRVLGAVLNRLTPRRGSYHRYYHYYRSGNGHGTSGDLPRRPPHIGAKEPKLASRITLPRV